MRAALFAIVLMVSPALGDTAPQRITGTIINFAAPVLTVKTAKGQTTVTLAPEARVVANQREKFATIKNGDFVATTSMAGKDGRLVAQELRIFPEPLRGLGEGQYPYAGTVKSLTNGTVSVITPAAKGKPGSLKLVFYGSTPGPNGICSGHAPAPGQGPCSSDADIVIGPKTTIVSWVLGDPSWLLPGKAVSLFAISDGAGKLSTYGVVAEHNGVKPLP